MKPHQKRVLVVGTTADYIEVLEARFPERCLFLTDPRERAKAGRLPENIKEILCPLDQYDQAVFMLGQYLQSHDMVLLGVACYDCESMRLASRIAKIYDLPFASEEAVLASRSKFYSKKIWREQGVPCPEAAVVRGEDDLLSFFDATGGPVVLKPLTGSGSELVFLCRDREMCLRDYRYMTEKLSRHPNQRMYGQQNMISGQDPKDMIGVESFAGGDEFSCDFFLENGRVQIIRLIKKILFQGSSFGSTLAYRIQTDYADVGGEEALKEHLKNAAQSLGLKRALAMVDFKIDQGRISFIELTPRPGGDCIPPLIKESSGFDTLGAALDFSEGRSIVPAPISEHKPLVGMHLFAAQAGILKRINAKHFVDDPRVILYHLKRSPGDEIKLPPEDYDSRILGYVIFEPSPPENLERECLELAKKLVVEYDFLLDKINS